MSTPLIPPERFANIRDSLQFYAPINSGFLGSEICRAISCDFFGTDIETKNARISELVFDWQRANWSAHVVRYYARTKADAWKSEYGPKCPSPELPRGRVLSEPELLKALQAVHYNCDGGESAGDTIKPSLDVLSEIIDALKDTVLELLPEYKNADWAIG